jgi:pyruvate formate lyase activating enzyme
VGEMINKDEIRREALFYEKLAGSYVRCGICRWLCKIAPGSSGVCRMYQNSGGVLYNLNYGRASSVAVDPIEKKPLYHFHPGSRVFSLGSWGCNFHCPGCQNWSIACVESAPAGRGSEMVSPEEAIRLTQQNDCEGIAWTYNEPAMWFEYTLDSAKLARQNGLYTVYVTNGYMTFEALDAIGPYLDAWRVDVKGFTSDFYRRMTKITHWQGILETAERAKKKWGMHIEVVTNITPGQNDDNVQLRGIASWIKAQLGELTPWHVTRFYPQYHEQDIPPTPIETLERAMRIGRETGLKFIYPGNVPGHTAENTICYQCGKMVVQRQGYTTQILGLKGSRCQFCGADLNFRGGQL